MKTNLNIREKIAIPVLVLAVLVSTILFINNRSNHANLKKEKINNETLLSEKLNLAKDNAKLKNDVGLLVKAKKGFESQIQDIQLELKEKESELALQMRKGNEISVKLKTAIEDLQKELNSLNSKNLELTKAIALNELTNQQLLEQLDKAKFENDQQALNIELLKAVLADNYYTEAVKGKKDKTTNRALFTNKLKVSFDLPNGETNGVYFTIDTPNGKTYSSKDNELGFLNIKVESQELASLGELIKPDETERLVLTYKPDKKLSKGMYKFNLYNGDYYLGSTQLKLR